MNSKEQIEQFDTIGNMSEAWRLSADELLSAARVLEAANDAFDRLSLGAGDAIPDEGRVGAVERMLKGFAVECLLKAVWVKQGNKLADEGRYVSVPNAGQHDLPQLADATGVPIDQQERDILKRLTGFMKSVGRYPISKNASDPAFPGIVWSTPSDTRTLGAFVDRLYQALK